MALKDYIVHEVALDCEEGLLTRREALRRLGLMGVTGAAAAALLAACGDDDDAATATDGPTPTTATEGTTPPTTEPAGTASSTATESTSPEAASSAAPAPAAPPTVEEIRFSGPNGELIGVVAEAESPRGAVLVIHENRGLTPHIRSIPPRLAADGYTALAIDLLSEEGGTASLPSEGDATAALGNAPTERMIADLRAGLDELGRRAEGAKLATIGFCFGGGMTWQLLAAGEPRLAAAVPFYGPFPSGASLAGSPNAAVLGVYAGLDDRVNGTMEAAETALTEAGLTHELRVFDGVDHAFFNDTGPRYDAAAATEAYQAMLDWFGQHLATYMTGQLRTFLTFQQGAARAALDHYEEIFDDFEVVEIEYYGPGDVGPDGTVKVASFRLAGSEFSCADSPVDHAWGFTPAVSLWIDCDDAAELERLFDRLSAEGVVYMPLDDYGFSTRFGWVGDRHGVTWQLNLT